MANNKANEWLCLCLVCAGTREEIEERELARTKWFRWDVHEENRISMLEDWQLWEEECSEESAEEGVMMSEFDSMCREVFIVD